MDQRVNERILYVLDCFCVLEVEMTIARLILINMGWNSIFILMMLSELVGMTHVHEWVWRVSLGIGNLVIDVVMLWYCWNVLKYLLNRRS